MEIKFFEASLVKEKFALLIAKLHRAGLLTEYIGDAIIKSPFFDCFENNDINDFMTLSFEAITKMVFNKEVLYDNATNYINDYYWAGQSIMNIMMNLEVPLKRILLIMPLQEIVGAFEVYHEMHDQNFLEHYLELEKERSLLKAIRSERGLSIPDIAYLTGIKASVLNLYDRSNDALFVSSFSNLTRLSNLFGISIDAFRTKSSFEPISQYVMQSKAFEPILVDGILKYFHIKDDATYTTVDHYLDDREIRALLDNHKAIVDLSNPFGIIHKSSNRIIRKYLSKEEFIFIHKAAIEKLKEQTNDLIF